jgi:hypothetical protein
MLLCVHLRNLSDLKPRKRGEVDPHAAIARAKIDDAETFEEAVGYLSPREKFAVLNSSVSLSTLLALPSQNEVRHFAKTEPRVPTADPNLINVGTAPSNARGKLGQDELIEPSQLGRL